MLKKIWNVATAPVRLMIAAGVMIYVALVLAFNEEERRQYNYDCGNGELD